MRITICCKKFAPGGGAEFFMITLARNLLADGHRVKVIAADTKGAPEGIETERLSVSRPLRAWKDVALARASAEALARDDADVSLSGLRCHGADVVWLGGGVEEGFIKCYSRSFTSPMRRAWHRLSKLLGVRRRIRVALQHELYSDPGPRAVIAVSEMIRQQLVRHYPQMAGRTRVIYPGIDVERFSPALRKEHRSRVREELGIPPGALVCVFVGSGWQRKNAATLVRALGILADRDTPRQAWGVIVGSGNRRHTGRLAARCGAAGRVRFTGVVRPDPYYAAADLFVLPSFYDPCPYAVMEGLACGLPAIVSAYVGEHELLTPGQDGFYLEDPADAERLADYVNHFMDQGRLEEASRAARALALEHPLEREYREIMDLLEALAQSG